MFIIGCSSTGAVHPCLCTSNLLLWRQVGASNLVILAVSGRLPTDESIADVHKNSSKWYCFTQERNADTADIRKGTRKLHVSHLYEIHRWQLTSRQARTPTKSFWLRERMHSNISIHQIEKTSTIRGTLDTAAPNCHLWMFYSFICDNPRRVQKHM